MLETFKQKLGSYCLEYKNKVNIKQLKLISNYWSKIVIYLCVNKKMTVVPWYNGIKGNFIMCGKEWKRVKDSGCGWMKYAILY